MVTKTIFLCPNCINSEVYHKVVTRYNKYLYPVKRIEQFTWCKHLLRYISNQKMMCPYYQNKRLMDYV